MSRAFDASRRPSNGPCAAAGCERGAVIATTMGRCCNAHYQNVRKYGVLDRPERKLSRATNCAQCGGAFDRGYAMNASRAADNQFCSRECRAQFSKDRANDRLHDRFWGKVSRGGEDECWLWTAQRNDRGYGIFTFSGTSHIASRVAYEIHYGTAPGTLFICHSCDNPPCCNPAHLWLGTHTENMRDCANKGRAARPRFKGEGHPSAKLRQSDVLTIRRSDESNAALARRYDISAAAIYNIRNRLTWAHVP